MPEAPALVRPAHLWVPPRVGSYGDEAVDLARLAGRELDPEQELAVDALLSYGPGGRWVALESAIVEGRQNGKTGGVILPVVMFDLFILGADRIVWTAHLFRTARDAFNDAVAMVDQTAELSSRVKKITFGTDDKSIELHSGAKLEFLARSTGGGRGLGGKRVVFDEALILSSEAMGALIPTLSARSMTGDPQIMYGSSAGARGSDQLRSLRNRGRSGGDPSLIWVEWCAPGSFEDPPCSAGISCSHAPGTEGCALDNEEFLHAANPALGRRISMEYVRSERRALPPLEFARERLGWHEEPDDADESPISVDLWGDRRDPESVPLDPVALSIDTKPDRSWTSLGVAGRRDDGRVHVEVIEHRRGTDWVVARISDLVAEHRPCVVVLDPAGPAGSFIPDLEAVGVKVKPGEFDDTETLLELVTAREHAQACGALTDLAVNDHLRHRGQPPLDAAIKDAKKRGMADAWLWDRKTSDVDISPLVAVTLAAYGLAVHGDVDEEVQFW